MGTSGYLLILPFLALVGVFGLLPMLFTGWIALHDWHLVVLDPNDSPTVQVALSRLASAG